MNRARTSIVLAAFAMVGLAAQPSAAQNCSVGSPARASDNRLWGSLRPGDVDGSLSNPLQLPDERDSTSYDGHGLPSLTLPLYTSVDVEQGWLFTTSVTGLQIWDVNGANAEKPLRVGHADLRSGGCTPNTAFWAVVPECTEVRHFIFDVDAPPGKSDVVAISGLGPVGFAIIDTTNKTSPKLLYQHSGMGGVAPDGSQVRAMTIGGRDYAFFGSELGLQRYDITAARTLNKCEQASGLCGGVYKGRVGGGPTLPTAVVFVDALSTSTGKHFVATSSLTYEAGNGLRLWDVSNADSPISKRFLTGEVVYGMAMWEEAGSHYLALHSDGEGRIYNVTSCLANFPGCTSLLSPIWTGSWSTYGKKPIATRLLATFSRSGSTPFVYFGANDQCSGGPQREFLFDVSNPANPDEITPEASFVDPDGVTLDYWGWYYAGNNAGPGGNNPAGFSRVMPLVAKFNGPVLYRAGYTIFDTHVWTQAAPTPPIANFSHPDPIYANIPATFTDTSTGAVTSRLWTFPAEAIVSSTTGSPVSATFPTVGSKQVTLRVDNSVGFDEETKTIDVKDPAPAIGSVTHAPGSPQTCQAVTFTANDVTGFPAPTVSWVVKNGASPVYGPVPGNPLVLPGNTLQIGITYTAEATATSGVLSALKTEDFSFVASPALGFTGPGGAPTNDAFAFGTVNFHANSEGATAWSWDFGDGVGFRGFSGTYNTPDPVFTYSTTGQKIVRVKIQNCAGELQSNDLTINVSQVQPLTIDTFQAQGCAGGFCIFQPNVPVTFAVQVSGGPTAYEYDWKGDGTWDTSTGAPQNGTVAHTYSQTGLYLPKLRVKRNSEPPVEKSASPSSGILIDAGGGGGGGGSNPSIAIGGPSTGQPNQAYTFTATASNCTPAGAWTWSTGGGTGSSTTDTIEVTWTTTGNKGLTAANSGCSGTTGTKSISIQNPGGGGGGSSLTANFTISPAVPKVGETVTLDGSASTGAPTGYTWVLPGGAFKDGQIVTTTFASTGTFSVTLEVSKPGNCLGGLCAANTTKTVTVTQTGGGGGGGGGGGAAGPSGLVADFTATPANPKAEETVTLDAAASQGSPTTFLWTLPGGVQKNGKTVTLTFPEEGTFQVTLEVGKQGNFVGPDCSLGFCAVTVAKNVTVGPADPSSKALVVPWIATTKGALVQSSDLYVHNPGSEPADVVIEFRKRGAPDPIPPRVTRTIQPGSTLYSADALKELFNKENIGGFISFTLESGDLAPVVTSFNTTFQNGEEFGQTVGAEALAPAAAATVSTQHLVGLVSNGERVTNFGISNPTDQPATFALRFFDETGDKISESSDDFTISRFGQVQFQPKQIEQDFGVSDEADYRVEVETTSGGALMPYASIVRLSSDDPSFVVATATRAAKVYLVGALSSPGLNNSVWQTDAVLANVSDQPVTADLTFTSAGLTSVPTAPLHLSLAPGSTERLENVIASQLGINNAVGVLTLTTTSTGAFPVIQGESYDVSNPAKRFGQSMMAVSEADAAGPDQSQYLTGLRQGTKNRTTFWVFNPGSETGEYEIVYRDLAGTVLGTVPAFKLGAGKLRQFSPGQHPLPAGGATNGFQVQIKVKSGKVLGAAQVVNNVTNDPAYIQGEVR